MRRIVADASVVVKWLYPTADGEADVPQALALLQGVRAGTVRLVQPPHWLAEVAVVAARVSPETALADVADLSALVCDVRGDTPTLLRATVLAVDLDHHLFDTLYHAVALETPGAVLVTADERYARVAGHVGALVRLAAFETAQ